MTIKPNGISVMLNGMSHENIFAALSTSEKMHRCKPLSLSLFLSLPPALPLLDDTATRRHMRRRGRQLDGRTQCSCDSV